MAARVIGTGTGLNSKVVLIDRGSSDGVMRGMAVITPDGIVGRVQSVYPNAAQVLLITDPTFAAGVISQRHRIHGTLKGLGQSVVMVDYIQNEEKVDQGEWFFTSGDDRVFPKGMPVGRVSSAKPGRTFQDVLVVPSGLAGGLEEVLVVVHGVHQVIPDEQPSSQQVYSMPPPPPGDNDTTPERDGPVLTGTDADRIREKYQRIGQVEGHVYGGGVPGSPPPDFNIPLPPRGQAEPSAGAPDTANPAPSGQAPAASAPESPPPGGGQRP